MGMIRAEEEGEIPGTDEPLCDARDCRYLSSADRPPSVLLDPDLRLGLSFKSELGVTNTDRVSEFDVVARAVSSIDDHICLHDLLPQCP